MGLDVRKPIGAMFAVVGVMLVIYGVVTRGESAMYERSLGVNVNLWWGVALLAFGIAMLVMSGVGRARRGLERRSSVLHGSLRNAPPTQYGHVCRRDRPRLGTHLMVLAIEVVFALAYGKVRCGAH
jgi:hypothetical protein